jgi:hypothetical protein
VILTRRGFLRGLLPAAVAAPVLLEELLHPGRMFFLPPRNITIYQGYEHLRWARDIAKMVDELVWRTFNEGAGFMKVSALPELKAEIVPRQKTWDVFPDREWAA